MQSDLQAARLGNHLKKTLEVKAEQARDTDEQMQEEDEQMEEEDEDEDADEEQDQQYNNEVQDCYNYCDADNDCFEGRYDMFHNDFQSTQPNHQR